jgi:hypothetical protein
MTVVFELIGVAVGALVCGLPYVVYGATSPPIAITSVVLGVAAAGLALLRSGARWQTGAGVGIGLLVVIVVQIVVDFNRDPTSHNLAPFEIVSALVIGLPPAILGVLLVNLVRPKVPWPEVGGIALVTLSLAVAAVSASMTAGDITRLETLALKKVVALMATQYEFRAAHPARGYTCDLRELGESFSGPIKSNHPSESYRLNGIVYRGGTAAFEGEYRYSLKCEGKPDPQELFVLTARAQPVGARPLDTFCVGPDGTIRAIDSGRLYSCFEEGRIVQNVN